MKSIQNFVLFFVGVVLCTVQAGAWTYDETTKTITDGNWTLSVIKDGTNLTIKSVKSGSGDCDLSGAIEGGYTVTRLENRCFKECFSLTAFTSPTTLQSIEESAFYRCSALTNIQLVARTPGLTAIGKNCFNGCTKLVTAKIDSPCLARIGETAFMDVPLSDTDAGKMSLASVESFGIRAFRNCSFTGTVMLASCREFLDFVFWSCPKLNELIIDSPYLTNIPAETFLTAENVCSVTNLVLRMPGLTNISSRAFAEKLNAKSDVSDWRLDSLKTIGQRAFRNCANLYGVLNLPAVVKIDDYAFWGCNSLQGYRFGSPDPLVLGANATLSGSPCELLFGTTGTVTCVSGNFASCGSVTNFYFYGPAQPIENLNMMLSKNTNYKARFFVSKAQPGWIDIVTPLTDDDRTNPEFPTDLGNDINGSSMRVIGTSGTLLTKKVWFIQAASPYDIRLGMAIIIH